jgi:pimeloyl-ACP methyl ester carboxylesterase
MSMVVPDALLEIPSTPSHEPRKPRGKHRATASESVSPCMPHRTPLSLRLLDFLFQIAAATPPGHFLLTECICRWLTKPSPARIRRTPALLGQAWEPLTCTTPDGLQLAGWAVTPPQPRGTVALFHAIRANREQTLSRTAFLVAAGFRCLAFDHRAHGESEGKRSSFGYHERGDVQAVLELIEERWPGEPYAALGLSMGAAALCYASEHTRRCRAVILENMYTDVISAWKRRLQTRQAPPMLERLTPALVRVCERLLNGRVEEAAPILYMEHLAPARVFVLTGSEDPHATPEGARALHERCSGTGELWIVPGAGHSNVCETGGILYRERILGFLERAFSQKSIAA